MIKVGITGQAGFMGSHLYNYLGLKENIVAIPFLDEYFSDINKFDEFVSQCDTIVHLAAMNRHNDPEVIYNTNIRLVNDLLASCERTNSKPHIIFSSSTQEERNNLYGKSKRDGRLLFEDWCKKNGCLFTAIIIPNVFGPFGNPYYNSVIATFCHQLTHNDEPKIEIDGEIKLIYINELVEHFYTMIVDRPNHDLQKQIFVNELAHSSVIKVSELLMLLLDYKNQYFEKGIIPSFSSKFALDLFNTFRCYMPHEVFPFPLKENIDNRGSFVEIIRTNTSGQFSYSTTVPGITRGNHFHTRKIERFAVIKGTAEIAIRRVGTKEVIIYKLDGKNPSFVDMPIWCTHNITNIGEDELITLFWINEPYDPADPDTYFENVKQ